MHGCQIISRLIAYYYFDGDAIIGCHEYFYHDWDEHEMM